MRVYSYAYSDAYTPEAPAVEIGVYSPGQPENQTRLTLLLDTGADVTALPLRLLNRIAAGYLETVTLRGITGGRVRVDMYQVMIQVGPHTVGAVRVVGVAATTDAVLGRDVLNQLVITLDGPAQTTEIVE